MPNNRLICFDMGSMSEGVELRSPFLNYKLFEIYQNINPRFIDEKNPKFCLNRKFQRKTTKNQASGLACRPENQWFSLPNISLC